MKSSLLICTGLVLALFAGCAPFESAYYVDREFGQGSQTAWDMQVINKENRYSDVIPTELQGITTEEIMNVRSKTFAEKPRRAAIYDLGFTGTK